MSAISLFNFTLNLENDKMRWGRSTFEKSFKGDITCHSLLWTLVYQYCCIIACFCCWASPWNLKHCYWCSNCFLLDFFFIDSSVHRKEVPMMGSKEFFVHLLDNTFISYIRFRRSRFHRWQQLFLHRFINSKDRLRNWRSHFHGHCATNTCQRVPW